MRPHAGRAAAGNFGYFAVVEPAPTVMDLPSARAVAVDLVGAVLRRRRPLDDAIDDSPNMSTLAPRDRAFARLLVATVLRRLGQIDALIAHCLNSPLPPRAAAVHDMLRLGIAQLLFRAHRRMQRSPPRSISRAPAAS